MKRGFSGRWRFVLAEFRIVVGGGTAKAQRARNLIVADVRTCPHLRVSVIPEETIDSDHWQPQPPSEWVVPDPFPGSDPDLDALAELDRAGLDRVGPEPRDGGPDPAEVAATGGERWTDASLLGAPSGDPIGAQGRTEQRGGAAALDDLLAYAG